MTEPLDYAPPRLGQPAVLWRPWVNIPLAVVCLYAPYAWLIFVNYPWHNSYTLVWLRMWPILPGLYPALMLQTSAPLRTFVMAEATAVILILVMAVFARTRPRRTIVRLAVGLFLLSALNALVAYGVFKD